MEPSMKKTTQSVKASVVRLRKAIFSAATLIQDLPENDTPNEDTIDFIESDIQTALSALEDLAVVIGEGG
jgi:hypothetical protein